MSSTLVEYLPLWRPWFSLYGKMVRQNGHLSDDEEERSLIETIIPDDVLIAEVFSRLPSQTLGVLACVCKHFRRLVSCDSLYRHVFFLFSSKTFKTFVSVCTFSISSCFSQ